MKMKSESPKRVNSVQKGIDRPYSTQNATISISNRGYRQVRINSCGDSTAIKRHITTNNGVDIIGVVVQSTDDNRSSTTLAVKTECGTAFTFKA